MHSQQDLQKAQNVGSTSFDWSQNTEKVLSLALGQVPEVGSVLSGLLDILWPKSKVDVWAEIRDQTQALINQSISKDDWNRVQSVLGDQTQGSGLIGLLQNYRDALAGKNGQVPESTWTSANSGFILSSGQFQQTGCEILLLPLFAQMANLHLTLLQSGILGKFCTANELQQKVLTYTTWATTWSQQAVADQKAISKGQYNPLNSVVRFMQLNVDNFTHLWKFLDPTLYPNAVKYIPISPEIFYTITETIPWPQQGQPSPPSPNYAPPGTRDGYIKEIDIYYVDVHKGKYRMLGGCEIAYDGTGGSTGYTGVLVDNKTPPLNQDIYDVGYYSLTPTLTGSPDNDQGKYIVGIYGNWSADNYIRFINFTRQDKTSNTIPTNVDGCHDTSWPFNINPPPGYFLSSMWMPGQNSFYTGARDAIFGFQQFSRFKDPAEDINFDPYQWAQNWPVTGSAYWIKGYSVQYAIAWIYKDNTVSNLTRWCDPITSDKYAMPSLLLPTSTDPKIVGRKVYRKFATSVVQCVGTINASTERFGDDTL